MLSGIASFICLPGKRRLTSAALAAFLLSAALFAGGCGSSSADGSGQSASGAETESAASAISNAENSSSSSSGTKPSGTPAAGAKPSIAPVDYEKVGEEVEANLNKRLKDCSSFEEAVEMSGFSTEVPEIISGDLKPVRWRAIPSEMIEVTYQNEAEDTVRLRKGAGR